MIFVCEYDKSSPAELLRKYASYLPLPVYTGSLEGMKWEKRRERILAWLLLQNAVGEEKMKALDIQRTELGKPYSASDPGFHFNISHCDTACACMISDEPCGVDIEKKFSVRENLVRKICHPDEYAVLDSCVPEEKERQLRFLWSMKESFVKMDGRGLGYGMNAVNLVSLLPVKTEKLSFGDEVRYFVKEAEAYTLAGCIRGKQELSVHICSEAELMKKCKNATWQPHSNKKS